MVVVAKDEIEGVGHIEPLDVPFARPAEIDHVDLMRGEIAHRIRTDEKIIVVKMQGGFITHVMHTELCGIAKPNKILPVKVGNQNLLISPIKGIQLTVGIFLQHLEEDEVVLIPIVPKVAEKTGRQVRVIEEKTAKVAIECLNSHFR